MYKVNYTSSHSNVHKSHITDNMNFFRDTMTILIVYILFYLLYVRMNLIKITNIFITEL